MRRTRRAASAHDTPSLPTGMKEREKENPTSPASRGWPPAWRCNPNSPPTAVPSTSVPPINYGGKVQRPPPNPPRYARRVLPRLRPGRRRVRPSRAVARSAYSRSGPAAPVLRYPPCAAACMARAASSLRSGTGHASRSVVGDVHRSTPCRVRRARAVASSVTSPAVDAHDVPLRCW
jgi:hypothetical protein